MKTEIIPAVLPKNIEELREKLERINGVVPYVQIDVVDGQTVGKPGWPYVGDTGNFFQQIMAEEQGLPYWEELDFEADLMVKDIDLAIQNWSVAGASRMVIHTDLSNSEQVLHFVGYAKDRGIEPGLALHLEDSVSVIEPYIQHVGFVQCMGIKRVGFQGEEFDERTLQHVAELRKKFPELVISVDGGVNLENAERLIGAGANRLILGSALFDTENIKETLGEFASLE